LTRNRQLLKSSLIVILFLVGSISAANIRQAHAQTIYSVNALANPGFENGLSQWNVDTFDDGNGGSTITANNTLAVTGYSSARFDISQNRTANNPTTASPMTIGKITLYQVPVSSPYFANLTNRPDGLNLWLYIQPKFAGFSIIEIRIKATDTTELDYFYVNPSISIQFTNTTKGGENNKPVKDIILPMPPFNKWIHFERNLRQDWNSSMMAPNGQIGTTAPGFNLTETFNQVMLIAGFSGNSAAWYGETAWIDDAALFVNSTTPPPPPPPSNYYAAFNFEDTNGSPVNSLVRWKMFNSTGSEVIGYTQNNSTLTLEPYSVNVYYPTITGQNPEPYLILQQRIQLNTTLTVPLQMYPQNIFPWSYVAFNGTVANLKIIKENASFLQFSAQGNPGPYQILVNVNSKPVAIQRNNDDPASIKWSYDTNLAILKIPTTALGNFSIFIVPPLTVPNINFQDFTGGAVTSNISWRIFDLTGLPLTVSPGQLIENGTYTFQAYYEGYSVYSSTLTSTPSSLRLQLLPLAGQQKGYIAFNSTVNSITILTNTQDQLQFKAQGQGPHLVVVNVPSKPLTIERDGTTITSWTYNSTTRTVAIQTSQLGTFTLTYSNTPVIPILYVGAAIGAIAIVAAGLLIWERTRSKTPTQTAPVVEKPVTKEQPRLKPKNPQKGQRGRP
jgi:hypothetical protein